MFKGADSYRQPAGSVDLSVSELQTNKIRCSTHRP